MHTHPPSLFYPPHTSLLSLSLACPHSNRYALMEAMSPWVFVYFILIVVIGGFFVINLFLAVIFEEILQA